MIQNLLNKIRRRFKPHSIKLAAVVAIMGGIIVDQRDVLFALIGFVPTDPVTRFIFAAAVAALLFLGPYIARFWPQNINIVKGKDDAK